MAEVLSPERGGTPAAADSHPAPAPLLPAEEWALLQSEDRHAATAIILLMMAIFILGLIGYVSICIWAA